MIRYDALEALPVRDALPGLTDALEGHGTAVLVAPPGTGKTTLVPLALAGLLDGGPVRRVLVTEPRRIAARAAARRMAWLLGEKVGESVGYTVRGERVVGRRARVEVVTTGVLLQRLQRDQELPGVDVVVLDECHERHLDADTVAAFLVDVREALRPELRLVAASATTDAEGWARLLGGAPVVAAQGASYPVEVVWAPPARPSPTRGFARAGGAPSPPHGMRVDPAALTHVASVVRRALAERRGDVLCFLPGVGEIARVAGQLGGLGDVDVLQVHGRAPAAVQDAVLAGGDRRRVVLATSVAESSLTVPGVRVVVDSGLAREPRVDHARGLSTLTTVRASQAAGRQRAGRAGREAPGTVYRCWAEAEDTRLPRFPSPEIKVADLTAFALQTACWGDPDASGLALLDPPPGGAMAAARRVLSAIGAVDPAGRATDRGVRMSRLGLHPRLARALLDATPLVGAGRSAEVVALLSEEPPREYGDDLAAVLRRVRRGGDAYAARWRTEVRRLQAAAPPAPPARPLSPPQPDHDSLPGEPSGDAPWGEGESAGQGGGTGNARPGRGQAADTGNGAEHSAAAGGAARGHAAAAGVTGGAPPATADGGGSALPAAEGLGAAHTAATDSYSRLPTADKSVTAHAATAHDSSTPCTADESGAAHAAACRGVDVGGGEGAAVGDVGFVGGAGGRRRAGSAVGEGRVVSRFAGAEAWAGDRGVGVVVALAFPERVGRREGGSFLMVSGTRAEVRAGSGLGGAEWVGVAVADRAVGAGHARVRLAVVIDEGVAREAAGAFYGQGEEVGWWEGDVVARRVERLGAVELAVRPLKEAPPGLVRAALVEGLRVEGLGLLRWSQDAARLRERLAFLRERLGAPWPDVSDSALHARVEEWLEPELSRARRRADLGRIDAGEALRRLLPWSTGDAVRLDELAPERIEVPSGSRIRVDYSRPEQPVLAVKLQEMFGLRESPVLAGVPVLVHLLSPAGRPAAVTADLASFWGEGYRAVRAELRGRYPRHPWPEDPATAEPTRHTNARLRR